MGAPSGAVKSRLENRYAEGESAMEVRFTVTGETKARVERAAAERINTFMGLDGAVGTDHDLPDGVRLVARPLVETFSGSVEMWEAEVEGNV